MRIDHIDVPLKILRSAAHLPGPERICGNARRSEKIGGARLQPLPLEKGQISCSTEVGLPVLQQGEDAVVLSTPSGAPNRNRRTRRVRSMASLPSTIAAKGSSFGVGRVQLQGLPFMLPTLAASSCQPASGVRPSPLGTA